MKLNKILALFCILCLLCPLASCLDSSSPDQESSFAPDGDYPGGIADILDALNPPDNPRVDLRVTYTDGAGDTRITLDGTKVNVAGGGVKSDGADLLITKGGRYILAGNLSNARIVVNAPNEDVSLSLSGVDITCTYSAPLYIYKAKKARILLEDGSHNTLTDGENYRFSDGFSSAADEEPNACLYSKADLSLAGKGSLKVISFYNNGITSKDTLEISDLTLNVIAKNHGVNGKDRHTLLNATVTVSCGGDAIRSTNDTDADRGNIVIRNTSLRINAGEDGIQAENCVEIDGGTFTLKTGGGSGKLASGNAKGIEAKNDLNVKNGTFILDCSDDAFHANGNITLENGTVTLSTGNDAFHADGDLSVGGGNVTILKSYEGFEGKTVSIRGGKHSITASDDGINAAGGADGSGRQLSSKGQIDISGGYTAVYADGDGMDANGSITMTDGTLLIFGPTDNKNGAIDFDTDFQLSGGTLLAVGSRAMTQTPNKLSQYTLALTLDTPLKKDACIEIKSGQNSFVFVLPQTVESIVFSSPAIIKGEVFSVATGGSYSGGRIKDGIGEGGTVQGGETLCTLTVSDYLTSYGNTGGPGGPQGQRPNGQNRPQRP